MAFWFLSFSDLKFQISTVWFLKTWPLWIKFGANSDSNSASLMHIHFSSMFDFRTPAICCSIFALSSHLAVWNKTAGRAQQKALTNPPAFRMASLRWKKVSSAQFLAFSVLFKLLSGGVLLCHLLRRSFVTSLCLLGVLAVSSHEIRFRTFPYTM